MSARDLTAAAAANAARRRDEADGLVAADSSGRLARFRDLADRSVFGTNASAGKILVYDRMGEVVDTRRFHVHRAGGDVAAGLTEFATGSWPRRREAFEDIWQGGREFVYGAVNAGGAGIRAYGEFCLVEARPAGRNPAALAVFPDDTAQRYTTTSAVVDESRAVAEATTWDRRADLVTAERAADVGPDESQWPRLVCGDRYFEAIVKPGPPTNAIDEVRLSATYVEALDELQARYLADDDLTDAERAELAAYDVIHSWRKAGTRIREVDER